MKVKVTPKTRDADGNVLRAESVTLIPETVNEQRLLAHWGKQQPAQLGLELTFTQQTTLDQVRGLGPCTARDILNYWGENVGITAMNNRLATLFEMGFLNCNRKDGRTLVYSIKNAKE